MAARAALRFGNNLKEIRVHCCQSSTGSQGVRDFVNKHYKEIKDANPTLPILVRECSGIKARIWARHEYGKEQSALVDGLSAGDVLKTVQKLAADK
ncbi:NADH dehydrogenase [ubiquinone] 1 alpha subcomplex subunit 2 [Halotydeus destructor]|nr:NADH dehydrogenase [ubiquinone] 1 alpha subcomplex subunit 2 [Halotydeus destructor]